MNHLGNNSLFLFLIFFFKIKKKKRLFLAKWALSHTCRCRQGELKDHNPVLLVALLHFSSVALGGVWGCCCYQWVTQVVIRYSCDPVIPSTIVYNSLKSRRREANPLSVLKASRDADVSGDSPGTPQAGNRQHFSSPHSGHPACLLKSRQWAFVSFSLVMAASFYLYRHSSAVRWLSGALPRMQMSVQTGGTCHALHPSVCLLVKTLTGDSSLAFVWFSHSLIKPSYSFSIHAFFPLRTVDNCALL